MLLTGKVADVPIKVRELLEESDIASMASIVAEAFVDYPVMIRAFAHSGGDRADWIRRMVSDSARARLQSGIPIWLAERDGTIAGGAFLVYPDRPLSKDVSDWWERFIADAGSATGEFFERFVSAAEAVELPQPNLYLTMIGVKPAYQGQGVGRAIIDHIALEAAQLAGCKGIALDTEIESNVGLYERIGFRVIGQTSVDELPIWVMFREI